MPFPEKKRIIYKHNPLVEVICQFRFPAILSIDTEVPAKLQEAIRRTYPNFIENTEVLFRFANTSEARSPFPDNLELPPSASNRKNYEFLSSDGNWKINLTREFFALSTLNYHRWEDFKEHLVQAFTAFLEIYSPDHFSRIGLRYKDIFKRSDLGLESTDWSELLSPNLLGILNDKTVGPKVTGITCITEIKLSDEKSKVRVTSGLVEDSNSKEIGFIIDSDFFTEEKTNHKDAIPRLDYFNQRGSRLIQWVITDKLHKAMEPENI